MITTAFHVALLLVGIIPQSEGMEKAVSKVIKERITEVENSEV